MGVVARDETFEEEAGERKGGEVVDIRGIGDARGARFALVDEELEALGTMREGGRCVLGSGGVEIEERGGFEIEEVTESKNASKESSPEEVGGGEVEVEVLVGEGIANVEMGRLRAGGGLTVIFAI